VCAEDGGPPKAATPGCLCYGECSSRDARKIDGKDTTHSGKVPGVHPTLGVIGLHVAAPGQVTVGHVVGTVEPARVQKKSPAE